MRVIENHWLFKLPHFRNYTGISVTQNLIICKDKAYKSLIEHEKMHQVQMIYLGGLLYFWSLYLGNYLIGLVKFKGNHQRAYRYSWLEVEARKYSRDDA